MLRCGTRSQQSRITGRAGPGRAARTRAIKRQLIIHTSVVGRRACCSVRSVNGNVGRAAHNKGVSNPPVVLREGLDFVSVSISQSELAGAIVLVAGQPSVCVSHSPFVAFTGAYSEDRRTHWTTGGLSEILEDGLSYDLQKGL